MSVRHLSLNGVVAGSEFALHLPASAAENTQIPVQHGPAVSAGERGVRARFLPF